MKNSLQVSPVLCSEFEFEMARRVPRQSGSINLEGLEYILRVNFQIEVIYCDHIHSEVMHHRLMTDRIEERVELLLKKIKNSIIVNSKDHAVIKFAETLKFKTFILPEQEESLENFALVLAKLVWYHIKGSIQVGYGINKIIFHSIKLTENQKKEVEVQDVHCD